MTNKTQERNFVIYSANEASINSGAGFWSNENGWVDCAKEASHFTQEETQSLNLPMATGNDATWSKATNFLPSDG